MALEAVVFSQGFFGGCAMAAEGGGAWSHAFGDMEEVMDLDGSNWVDVTASSSVLLQGFEEPDSSTVPPPEPGIDGQDGEEAVPAGRRKRRRTRSAKNKEEVESQRMTHIAVERNRRKQMNDYLAVLRSLMPTSYVQRGDQASIIGGAINYVKELEQLLQSLEAQKRSSHQCPGASDAAAAVAPFTDFFTFPQYSMSAGRTPNTGGDGGSKTAPANDGGDGGSNAEEASGSKQSAVADIEVTMVESHANLKLLSRRRPKQLLRVAAGLQDHRLTVLHLNVTSAGHMILYSFSLKVEDDCQLSSVDDIATAVHRIVETIDEEHGCS